MEIVLFLIGGTSGEHEISLISGKHVLKALDRKKYESLVGVIQKNGMIQRVDESQIFSLPDNPRNIQTPEGETVFIKPFQVSNRGALLTENGKTFFFDIAFPLLHGPGGEDGTIQGIFEGASIPFVGCNVQTSAICMDKGTTKKICMQAGVPVIPFKEIFRGEELLPCSCSYPCFVKPAHLGSSLGISKVFSDKEYESAVEVALKLDDKVLVEPAVVGREIEVAVIGKRGSLVVSPAGEIRCKKGFYSYEAKYVNSEDVELLAPANLPPSLLKKVQDLSSRIFETLSCYGMARIDYFMTAQGEFLLSEVNTIPGFTPISMYPKLMQLTGISYSELITRLLVLAKERHRLFS